MESRKLLDEAKAKIQADVEIRKAQMNSKIAEASLAAQEATLKVKVIALVEDKSKRELQTSFCILPQSCSFRWYGATSC